MVVFDPHFRIHCDVLGVDRFEVKDERIIDTAPHLTSELAVRRRRTK